MELVDQEWANRIESEFQHLFGISTCPSTPNPKTT
jgi:hypothetical protein